MTALHSRESAGKLLVPLAQKCAESIRYTRIIPEHGDFSL
jgi:hypothetical protein